MNSEHINFLETFFISDNSLKPFNLNSKIKLWNYYDISNKRFLTFYLENNDLYILLKQNVFGSAFLGNQVIFEPKFIIIKKFDPTLILINFIYSCKENNKFTDIETLVYNYNLILQQNDDYEKNNKFKDSILFIKKILEIYKNKLNLICEFKNDDLNISYKFLESKVFFYLNNKINLNDNEILEIKSFSNEKEFEIYKKRKIEEKCRIICEFLPPEIKENYFNSKQIQYKYVEIKVENNNNNNNININKKRKNNNEENIKKTGKKNEKNLPNGQTTLNFLIKNK